MRGHILHLYRSYRIPMDPFEVLRSIKLYFFRKNKTKIEYNISADRL